VTLAGGRILVVDHDPISCEAVAYFLKSLGYRVATAPDGNRAVNIGMDADIELVILEAQLPIYDGVEVLALLRRRYLARPVKVIALTSDHSEQMRGAFERHGIDGFLTKPVDLTRLRTEVNKLIPGHGQLEFGLYRRGRERQLRLRAG
jgi:DNA-binding response OmpR family regulator